MFFYYSRGGNERMISISFSSIVSLFVRDLIVSSLHFFAIFFIASPMLFYVTRLQYID
jgi:hypothetical protein